MQFIQGNNRHQIYFSTLEDQVSAVRLIDAIIDKLNLKNQVSPTPYTTAKTTKILYCRPI